MANYRALSKEIEAQILKDRAEHKENPYACKDSDVVRRYAGHDTPRLWRPAFCMDVDKILHNNYYNRYSDKTQVISCYKNDDISRRALHVQLVSRIARTIGMGLNLPIRRILFMDTEKYDVIPVYMTKQNEMYVGDGIGNIESYKNIEQLLKDSKRVIMVNVDDKVQLMPFPPKKFGKNTAIDIDVAFPVVHGTNVEDGALQGYLKTLGIPFVGCDVTASAIGMDKYIMKTVLKENNIPVLDAREYSLADYAQMDVLLDQVERTFEYPVIVKPVNLGSSVGISVAKNRVELSNSMDDAFKYATKVLVEHAITNLREINCAVLGDESEAIASECEEPLHTKDILSYEDKYVSGSKNGGSKNGASKGMASVSRKIPADIPDDLREEIRDMAINSFWALGCNGVARIDFMIDEDTGKLYFNEINTIPGSLAFYLWEPIGITYKELLDRMIQLAMRRVRIEERLTFTFDTNILNMAKLGGSKGAKL